MFVVLSLAACTRSSDDSGVDLRQPVKNDIANIPPQCFTRTEDAGGRVQNPCYVCHADADEPNYQSQPENQLSYAFPLLRSAEKVRNDWKNFFVDRRPAIAATADDEILRYVRRDNTRDARGRIELTHSMLRVRKRRAATGNATNDADS